MDLSLTCVVATQLWHHTFFGGGLCDLPAWTPTPLREPYASSLDVCAPLEASCTVRAEGTQRASTNHFTLLVSRSLP